MPTSPTTSCSASRPSATASRRCWPSSGSAPAPGQWSRPARLDSAARPADQAPQPDRCGCRQQIRQRQMICKPRYGVARPSR